MCLVTKCIIIYSYIGANNNEFIYDKAIVYSSVKKKHQTFKFQCFHDFKRRKLWQWFHATYLRRLLRRLHIYHSRFPPPKQFHLHAWKQPQKSPPIVFGDGKGANEDNTLRASFAYNSPRHPRKALCSNHKFLLTTAQRQREREKCIFLYSTLI